MPIIKSAKKALRVSEKRNIVNDLTRFKIKSAVKAVKVGIAKNDKNIPELLQKAYRELDIATKKNVIVKNKASRLKSRLAKAIAKEPVAVKAKVKTKASKKTKKS